MKKALIIAVLVGVLLVGLVAEAQCPMSITCPACNNPFCSFVNAEYYVGAIVCKYHCGQCGRDWIIKK